MSRRSPPRPRAASSTCGSREDAQAGAEVVLGGIVLLVGLALALANVWIVLDAKTAVSTTARAGAQTFIEQNSLEAAEAALHAEAAQALNGRFPMRWVATPSLTAFVRCAPVDVTVSVRIPVVAIPFLGAIGGTKQVSSTHHTRVDPYRSRVPGEAECE